MSASVYHLRGKIIYFILSLYIPYGPCLYVDLSFQLILLSLLLKNFFLHFLHRNSALEFPPFLFALQTIILPYRIIYFFITFERVISLDTRSEFRLVGFYFLLFSSLNISLHFVCLLDFWWEICWNSFCSISSILYSCQLSRFSLSLSFLQVESYIVCYA